MKAVTDTFAVVVTFHSELRQCKSFLSQNSKIHYHAQNYSGVATRALASLSDVSENGNISVRRIVTGILTEHGHFCSCGDFLQRTLTM
jgi:hypothetical protein